MKRNLEIGKAVTEDGGRSQSFHGGDVPGSSNYDVGFAPLVVTGPVPDADPFGAMLDRLVHGEVLQMTLFVRNNDIDVVGAAEAVISHGQKAIDIRWQINTCDVRTFVGDQVEKARILMAETVVILAPHRGSDQQVQGGHWSPPRNLATFLQPFGMLIEHRIDHVHKAS